MAEKSTNRGSDPDRSVSALRHSHDVVLSLVEGHPGALRQIASRMSDILGKNVEASRLEGWTKPLGKPPRATASMAEKKAYSKTIDPICRVDRFVQHTGDFAPLDWLAARRGGIWVRDHETLGMGDGKPDDAVLRDWYQTWSELHDLRGRLKEAFEDDRRFDHSEADGISIRWLQVQRWIEAIMLRWTDSVPPAGSVSVSPDGDCLDEVPSWAVFLNVVEQLEKRSLPIHSVTSEERAESREIRRKKVISQEALAKHIGLSRESVRNWWKRPKKGTRISTLPNPLDECLALMEATSSHLPLEWLSARHGGYVVPGARRREMGNIVRDWMKTHLEWAELECAIGNRVLGNVGADRSAMTVLREEWQDVKECMPSLIGAIYRDAVQ